MSETIQTEESRQGVLTISDLLVWILGQRKTILLLWGVFILGTLAIALLLPAEFESTGTLLPIGSDSQSSSLAELSALAGLTGSVAPSSSPAAKIRTLLNSRTFYEKLAEDPRISDFLAGNLDSAEARKRLAARLLQFSVVKSETAAEGIISITAATSDPVMSSLVVSASIEELKKTLNDQEAKVQAHQMETLERQLTTQSGKLREQQLEMVQFQLENNLIDPQGQTKASLQTLTEMVNKKLELEARLSNLSTVLSPGNSRITTLESQLSDLSRQIEELKTHGLPETGVSLQASPKILVEYQNLLRNIDVSQKVFVTLLASLEQSRMNIAKDSLYLEVIDPPLVANNPSKPNRSLIVALGVIGGGVTAVFLLLAWRFSRNLWDRLVLTPKESR